MTLSATRAIYSPKPSWGIMAIRKGKEFTSGLTQEGLLKDSISLLRNGFGVTSNSHQTSIHNAYFKIFSTGVVPKWTAKSIAYDRRNTNGLRRIEKVLIGTLAIHTEAKKVERNLEYQFREVET